LSLQGVGGKETTSRFHRRLMAYRSPWSPTELLAEVYMLRGALISAFAHIEQKITMFIVRTSHIEHYRDGATPPFKHSSRINCIKRIIKKRGPLYRYRELIGCIVDNWDNWQEFRHTIAHASVSLVSVSPIEFQHCKPLDDRHFQTSTKRMKIEELRRLTLRAALFSRACDRLYQRMDSAKLLPDSPWGPIEQYSDVPPDRRPKGGSALG
jgi:hypothetical protein